MEEVQEKKKAQDEQHLLPLGAFQGSARLGISLCFGENHNDINIL